MTDEPAQATASEPDASRDRARIEPNVAPKSADLLPGLYLLGFLALAGAMYFLWANPQETRLAPRDAGQFEALQNEVNSLRTEVATLKAQPQGASGADIAKLQQQVSDVAARPIPAAVSLQSVEARLGALEGRPTATPEQLQQLSNQVIALARQTPDLQPLKDRLDGLDKRLEGAEAQRSQLAGRIEQLVQADKEEGGKLDAVGEQARQTADQLQAIRVKLQLASKLQGAAVALAAGNRLGEIPGAPPALARFANEAPPTEASLKGAFESYAAKAQQANAPSVAGGENFAERMWTRAQSAVTVRQGDRVLVGDPIAGVLAHARETLDDGDLAGAVTALAGLTGEAAAAMRPWVERAQSLLDARAAIASLAAG